MKKFFDKKHRTSTISYLLVIVSYIVFSLLAKAGVLNAVMTSLMVPVCAYMAAAIGLNMNVGISGELNLGQAGFMSIGAFTGVVVSGLMSSAIPNTVIRLICAIIAGAIMAGVFGFLIGIPVLKLQGDYLAIVTLAFGQIIMSFLTNLYVGVDSSGLHFAFLTNTITLGEGGKMLISGPMGATGVERISTFTMGAILILVSLIIVYNIMYSRNGRAIMAARDNRIAAQSVGINVTRTKMMAFVISAALAGAGGALYGLNYSSMAASKFNFNTSILILVYVVLGGLGKMNGTIIATTVLVVLPEMLRFLSTYRMLIYAIVLIVMMLITNNEKLKTALSSLRQKRKPKEEVNND